MKKALITGASGGIGLEVARQLASKDYQITLVARSEDKLNKAVAGLENKGHTALVADITNKNDLQKLQNLLRTESYDVLINNAGAGIYGQFINTPLEDQLATMELNMNALVTLSYRFLETAAPGSTLVNIGSLLAHSSFPGAAVYAGTKSFVANFTESLWYEFKQKGIFIMSFNPGATKSDFHKHAGSQTNAFPNFVLSSVEDVAKELVVALEKTRKPRVVQGWKNRLMLFGFRFLTRRAAINIMGKISPGMAH
jgi:short-subunit dehydrogenase